MESLCNQPSWSSLKPLGCYMSNCDLWHVACKQTLVSKSMENRVVCDKPQNDTMTPKKKSKAENNPQRWDCAICAKALTAPNELTFHYINHSILELAVGKA